MTLICINHSWVSFQEFSESYNDTFKIAIDKELSPHIVSEAFYNGELENELRRILINVVDYRFKKDSDQEECMGIIEEIRRGKLYPHHQTIEDIPTLNLPDYDVCTASPEHGKAFCSDHCKLLQCYAPTVPVELKEFLKFCGAHSGSDDSEETKADEDKIDQVIKSITVHSNNVGEIASMSQGTCTLIANHPELVPSSVLSDKSVIPFAVKILGKANILESGQGDTSLSYVVVDT